MRKFFFYIIFFLLTQSNIIYANDKIFFIDLDYLINNSNFSKKILDEVKLKVEQYTKTLEDEELDLRDFDKNLSQKKNIISDEEFKNQLSILKERISSFNSKKEKTSLEIKSLKQEKINFIIQKINPIIENYTKEKDLDMILNKNSIYLSKNKYDLTDTLLKIINDQIK